MQSCFASSSTNDVGIPGQKIRRCQGSSSSAGTGKLRMSEITQVDSSKAMASKVYTSLCQCLRFEGCLHRVALGGVIFPKRILSSHQETSVGSMKAFLNVSLHCPCFCPIEWMHSTQALRNSLQCWEILDCQMLCIFLQALKTCPFLDIVIDVQHNLAVDTIKDNCCLFNNNRNSLMILLRTGICGKADLHLLIDSATVEDLRCSDSYHVSIITGLLKIIIFWWNYAGPLETLQARFPKRFHDRSGVTARAKDDCRDVIWSYSLGILSFSKAYLRACQILCG